MFTNFSLFKTKYIMIIPLIHHKNSGYTEFKVLGVYLSPAEDGGTMRKNRHFVSSAIHIKIGRKVFCSGVLK